MNTKIKLLLMSAVFGFGYATPGYAGSSEKNVTFQNSENVTWKPFGAVGAGWKIAVLEGKLDGSEIVSVRLSFPPNSKTGFHRHIHHERGIVIKGSSRIVYREDGNEKEIRLGEGDYYALRPGVIHRAFFDKNKETVLQIITKGPMRSDPVN